MILNQKYSTGRTKLALWASSFVVFGTLFFVGTQPAYAETVFITPMQNQEIFLNFPVSGSGLNRTPDYFYAYKIPSGITFDTVQIQVKDTTDSNSVLFTLGKLNDGFNAPWNCINSNCTSNHDYYSNSQSVSSFTVISSSTIEYKLSSAFVATSSLNYFSFFNSDQTNDYTYLGIENVNYVAINGSLYSKSHIVPSIQLCNGTCTKDFKAIPSTYQTRFIDVDFTGTSTSLFADVEYFIETSELSAENRPDWINVSIMQKDLFDSPQVIANNKIITPLSQGIATTSINLGNYAFPDGDYSAYFTFWNIFINGITFKRTALNVDFTIAGGVVTSTSIDVYDGTVLPDIQQIECGLTSIDGCISKAVAFLFVPEQSSLDQFTYLQDSLNTKAPFVYTSQISAMMDDLYTSSSTASSSISYEFGTLGTITLISVAQLQSVSYTGWIRTIVGYLMYITFAWILYRRTLKIFNTNPQ